MAWVLGTKDIKEIDAGRMDPEGRGLTQAGMILGIIGTALQAIPMILFALYMIFLIIVVVIAGAAQ